MEENTIPRLEENKKFPWVWISVILAVIIVGGGGWYTYQKYPQYLGLKKAAAPAESSISDSNAINGSTAVGSDSSETKVEKDDKITDDLNSADTSLKSIDTEVNAASNGLDDTQSVTSADLN